MVDQTGNGGGQHRSPDVKQDWLHRVRYQDKIMSGDLIVWPAPPFQGSVNLVWRNFSPHIGKKQRSQRLLMNYSALKTASTMAKHLAVDLDGIAEGQGRKPPSVPGKGRTLCHHILQYNGGRLESRLSAIVNPTGQLHKLWLANFPLHASEGRAIIFGPQIDALLSLMQVIKF
jgi:hypothetical protein